MSDALGRSPPRISAARGAAGATLAAALLLHCPGFAQPASATSSDGTSAAEPTAPPTAASTPGDTLPAAVQITLVGAASATDFRARLQSWFDAATVINVAAAFALDPGTVLGPKSTPGIHVWVTVPSSRLARLYLVVVAPEPTATQRFLLRDVPLDQGLDELGLERIAQVIHASSLALWHGSEQSPRNEVEQRLEQLTATEPASEPAREWSDVPGPDDPEPAAPAPRESSEPVTPSGTASRADRPPGAPSPSPAVRVALGYGATTRGPEGLAHGPQLDLALLTGTQPLGVGGTLSARYLLPIEAEAEHLAISTTGVRLRAGAASHWTAAERLAFETAVTGGVDVIAYEARSTAQVRTLPRETEARPVVAVQIGFRVPARDWSLAGAATLDVQLLRTHYDIARAGGPDRVLEPFTAQPGFVVVGSWGDP